MRRIVEHRFATGFWMTPGLVIASLTSACNWGPRVEPAQAEIGVFYGGQMQKLERVNVSRAKTPKVGFRVQFSPESEAVTDELEQRVVTFEVIRPGPVGRRVTLSEELKIPWDQRRLDQVIAIADEDRLGVWNIRVVYRGEVLADRALYLERGP